MIGNLFALVIGYLVGAKTGGKDLEQLSQSLKALCQTDEFGDVVAAARVQFALTLREVASLVDVRQDPSHSNGDLVSRVRSLVGHDL